MPRGGSSSGSGSRSYSSAPARRAATPKPAHSSTSQAQQRPNGLAGFAATILEGFGLRMGWDITERMMTSIFGPRTINHQIVGSAPPQAEAYDTCAVHSKAFQDCLNNCGSEIGKCQFYMDMYLNSNRNDICKCQLLMDMLSECRDKSSSANNA